MAPKPPSKDPWTNRSKGMRCATCIFFVPKRPELQTSTQTFSLSGILGRCRRHAPTLDGYPAVFQADWCGDHKLNEANLAGVVS